MNPPSSSFGGVSSPFGNCKMRRIFPERMHMRIYVGAEARGLKIAPALVGMRCASAQSELTLLAAEKAMEERKFDRDEISDVFAVCPHCGQAVRPAT
jgi:uncharacterized protein with PIN domain